MDKCPKCHAPARCGPPDGDFRYVPPISYRNGLTAANKAIVAMADVIEYIDAFCHMPKIKPVLEAHAPAIKRAKDTK